jgi:hypothetical protein
LTVASLATIMQSTPLTRPMPVTMPPEGTPPPYMSCPASALSSKKGVPTSTRVREISV